MEFSNETIEAMDVAAEEWDVKVSSCKGNWSQTRGGERCN